MIYIYDIWNKLFNVEKKNIFFFNLKFVKTVNFGILDFWLKNPHNYKSCSKTVKIIKLPYHLSHFIKKYPLFDVDLFSWTFDKESPPYARLKRKQITVLYSLNEMDFYVSHETKERFLYTYQGNSILFWINILVAEPFVSSGEQI